MSDHPKPRIVVSKCLGFGTCRYNGQVISDPFISKMQQYAAFLPVCPEMEIGLGMPRNPIRIILDDGRRRLYQPAAETDVTEKMERFTAAHLASLERIDGFILKNRSPSCGVSDVKIFKGYDAAASSVRGSGFFGAAIEEAFKGMPLEDEGRLRNFTLREHFLTKVYTFARLRLTRKAGTMGALVDFHTRHKLLFLGYNQAGYRAAGPIVANHEHLDFATVTDRYETALKSIMEQPPRDRSMINALQHAFGGVSDDLSHQERAFFLDSLEEYLDERIPLSTLTHLLKSWAVRFNNSYLLSQTLLDPYPKELVMISDSGKGRNL